MAVAGVVLLLLSRGHYSIDCLLAYWVTSRVWWTYHTLACNTSLQEQGGHNHMDNIWWWWLLRWAEASVPAQLPKRYSLSLVQYILTRPLIGPYYRFSLPAPASVERAVISRWRGWRHGEGGAARGEGVAGGGTRLVENV